MQKIFKTILSALFYTSAFFWGQTAYAVAAAAAPAAQFLHNVGAKGYLLKDSAISDIVGGIKAVASGHYYISPAISGYLVNRSARRAAFNQRMPGMDVPGEPGCA